MESRVTSEEHRRDQHITVEKTFSEQADIWGSINGIRWMHKKIKKEAQIT